MSSAERAGKAARALFRSTHPTPGEVGAVFDRDRKQAQARSISSAVTEISAALARAPGAAEEFNRTRVDDVNLARTGIRDAFSKAAATARPIPPTLVRGWANTAADWRATFTAIEGSDFVGEDIEQMLVAWTDRIREWQDRLRPYLPLAAELPRAAPRPPFWETTGARVAAGLMVLAVAGAAALAVRR